MTKNKPKRRFQRHPSLPNVSLSRALSKLGFASRKQARDMIRSGRVTVNGRALTNPEVRVHPERETIAVDGQIVTRGRRLYIMMHKPEGYVTTRSDERGRATVYDLLKDHDRWLFPVGRLDQDSQGLLLFTNDTQWANALTDPASKVTKVYELRLDREITDRDMDRFRTGVTLNDGDRTLPAKIRRLKPADGHGVEVTITEGKNRQVRRMMAALGYDVQALLRTRIGPVSLSGLREGDVRPLTPDEIRTLKAEPLRKK
ncbi:MAG: rRNA pseudouridine synthase [Nitrospirae bacterium]|nr:rRNA pseudouridine synthase [Nitrospirota bacterium]